MHVLVLTIELNEVRRIPITYHSNAIGGSSGGDGDYEEDVLRACVRYPIGVDSRNAELQGKNMLVTSVNIFFLVVLFISHQIVGIQQSII